MLLLIDSITESRTASTTESRTEGNVIGAQGGEEKSGGWRSVLVEITYSDCVERESVDHESADCAKQTAMQIAKQNYIEKGLVPRRFEDAAAVVRDIFGFYTSFPAELLAFAYSRGYRKFKGAGPSRLKYEDALGRGVPFLDLGQKVLDALGIVVAMVPDTDRLETFESYLPWVKMALCRLYRLDPNNPYSIQMAASLDRDPREEILNSIGGCRGRMLAQKLQGFIPERYNLVDDPVVRGELMERYVIDNIGRDHTKEHAKWYCREHVREHCKEHAREHCRENAGGHPKVRAEELKRAYMSFACEGLLDQWTEAAELIELVKRGEVDSDSLYEELLSMWSGEWDGGFFELFRTVSFYNSRYIVRDALIGEPGEAIKVIEHGVAYDLVRNATDDVLEETARVLLYLLFGTVL